MNCCHSELVANADNILLCCLCEGKHHYECLNVTHSQYAALSAEFKASWKCPSCSNVTRRNRSNVNTPVRSYTDLTVEDNSMDMSCDILDERSSLRTLTDSRNRNQHVEASAKPISSSDFHRFTRDLNETLGIWRDEMSKDFLHIRDEIKSTTTNIYKEITSLRTEQSLLKQSVQGLRSDVVSLQAVTQDQKQQHELLEKRIADLDGTGSTGMELTVSSLESKIDTLEQQARQCNVEIGNLPERRNENLPAIIEAIGLALNLPLSQQSIVSVHRVPHAHQQNTRPKNVIVKFTSCIQRDNLISAFRKASSLRSEQIGITGTSCSIYINEHLTLKKKQLFRKAREVAKSHNYKYVWVRNATILVREREGEVSFAIRGERDLNKIKSKKPAE